MYYFFLFFNLLDYCKLRYCLIFKVLLGGKGGGEREYVLIILYVCKKRVLINLEINLIFCFWIFKVEFYEKR